MASGPVNGSMTSAQTISQLMQIINDLNTQIDGLKSPVDQKYRQAVMACYDEQIALMKATVRLYSWQSTASTVMMWTVVAIVFAGLCFSGYQLYYAVQPHRSVVVVARPGKAGDPPAVPVLADSSLEVSAQKLKITSSIAGIVILGISVAFVIIFVDKVYTITSTPQASSGCIK